MVNNSARLRVLRIPAYTAPRTTSKSDRVPPTSELGAKVSAIAATIAKLTMILVAIFFSLHNH